MLRTGYTTRVRPWLDNPGDVEIRWYKCPEGAQALGVPSLFRSLHWEAYPYLFADGLGEVFNADVTVYPHKAPDGVTGDHHCGDDRDFAFGGLHDSDQPPFIRDVDGIPTCCRPPLGGLVFGGPFPGLGGLLLGGGIIDTIVNTSPSCFTAGAAHVGPGPLPFMVRLAPAFPTATGMFFYAVDHGTGPCRIHWLAGPPGSVAVRRLVFPSFCSVADTLYTGASDVPFTLDVTPTPTRDVVIAVGTAPNPCGPVILAIEAL